MQHDPPPRQALKCQSICIILCVYTPINLINVDTTAITWYINVVF